MKKDIITLNAYNNKAPVVSITKRHTPMNEHVEESSIYIDRKKNLYVLYSVNENKLKYNGTEFIILKNLNPVFNKILSRVCTSTIKMKHNNLVIISPYAPTHVSSKKSRSKRGYQ